MTRSRITTGLRSTAALAVLAAVAGNVEAQTVLLENGTPFVSSATTAAFSTTGADMGGMLVTAFFTGGGSRSGAWSNLGGGLWGVQNSEFALTHGAGAATGVGFTWTLANVGAPSLLRLVLSGAPGLTVFDQQEVGIGTPGSSTGARLFLENLTFRGNSTVVYRNIVAVQGSAAVGDLYEQVDLSLGGGGLAGGTSTRFELDTDNLPLGAIIRPDPTVVPEPSTIALVAAGLAAVAVRRGRRREPA